MQIINYGQKYSVTEWISLKEDFMNKKISVLMGIYNCEGTLKQAVESIRNQTYTDWELIMCDDGSTDGTYTLAKSLAQQDSRLILLKNDKNYGLNVTLNRCLEKATGSYIARMDGDDCCKEYRFEKQINFLIENVDFDIVSSSMILFDENGEWGVHSVIETPQKEDIISGSPICHAPVMMRKECIDAVNGYTVDKHMIRVEDVNLWIKLYAKGYRCYNIQQPLYMMRNDKNALNRRKYKYRINSTYVRLKGCKMLGLGMKSYLKAFRPMIIGLVPASLRDKIRKVQNKSKQVG